MRPRLIASGASQREASAWKAGWRQVQVPRGDPRGPPGTRWGPREGLSRFRNSPRRARTARAGRRGGRGRPKPTSSRLGRGGGARPARRGPFPRSGGPHHSSGPKAPRLRAPTPRAPAHILAAWSALIPRRCVGRSAADRRWLRDVEHHATSPEPASSMLPEAYKSSWPSLAMATRAKAHSRLAPPSISATFLSPVCTISPAATVAERISNSRPDSHWHHAQG